MVPFGGASKSLLLRCSTIKIPSFRSIKDVSNENQEGGWTVEIDIVTREDKCLVGKFPIAI